MMSIEKFEMSLHPERLTEKQERLADFLISRRVKAQVRRREIVDGVFRFSKVDRQMHLIELFSKEGEFGLKDHDEHPDAPLSPFYINFRKLPRDIWMTVFFNMLYTKIDEKADLCTGIPNTGNFLAKLYSDYGGKTIPFKKILEKKEDKIILVGKATARRKKLLVIDDVITKAHSAFATIEAAKESGFEIIGFLVLVDREQGGTEKLREAGYKVYSVFKLSQLLDYYLRKGKISQAKYNELKTYLSENRH